MTFCIDRGHDGPCYWLARENTAGHVELADGCHSTPAGVAKAAKLHHRIFGAEDDWFMVKVEAVPGWGAVPINERAAADCADLLRRPGTDETCPDCGAVVSTNGGAIDLCDCPFRPDTKETK